MSNHFQGLDPNGTTGGFAGVTAAMLRAQQRASQVDVDSHFAKMMEEVVKYATTNPDLTSKPVSGFNSLGIRFSNELIKRFKDAGFTVTYPNPAYRDAGDTQNVSWAE